MFVNHIKHGRAVPCARSLIRVCRYALCVLECEDSYLCVQLVWVYGLLHGEHSVTALVAESTKVLLCSSIQPSVTELKMAVILKADSVDFVLEFHVK